MVGSLVAQRTNRNRDRGSDCRSAFGVLLKKLISQKHGSTAENMDVLPRSLFHFWVSGDFPLLMPKLVCICWSVCIRKGQGWSASTPCALGCSAKWDPELLRLLPLPYSLPQWISIVFWTFPSSAGNRARAVKFRDCGAI